MKKIYFLLLFFIILGFNHPLQAQNQPQISLDAARQQCVNQINQFRASIGLNPLQRWTNGEACTDNATRTDSESGIAHGSMGSCGEFAQNTCPDHDSINQINTACLQSMWNEGPPPTQPCTGQCFLAHGHYINMANPSYTMVACGYHQTPTGKIWSNQNFK